MKLLLFSLLLAGASVGGYRLVRDEVPAAPTPCESSDCRVTVEPISPGTCLVTCYDADGSVRCQKEVDCDQACEQSCDGKPCEKMAEKTADKACEKPCAVPSSCSR